MNEKDPSIHVIDGGVSTPSGFMAAGVHAGIKKHKKDVAVIFSKVPAKAVAAFTTNTVKAAPVLWSEQVVKKEGNVQAIIVNSGNANACTGSTGMDHAIQMAETTAHELGLDKNTVIVSSTGIIGVPLPIEKLCSGIHAVCAELSDSPQASTMAAEAIMTTDTFVKQIAVSVDIEGKIVTIGGMAKGSGMIHPNMATMLSFVTTDADIAQPLLDALLKETVNDSYNMISVDGDTSTNDMVVVLANGSAKNLPITQKDSVAYAKFSEAFKYMNTYLAKQIVRDGEGASKVIEVHVTGAKSKLDAKKLVKSVITSNLVKTAFFGEDANWGRILAAMGYSGASFDTNNVTIQFKSHAGSILLMEHSEPVQFDEDIALKVLKETDIHVDIKLKDGEEEAVGWGCDLSYEYVRINGDYRT